MGPPGIQGPQGQSGSGAGASIAPILWTSYNGGGYTHFVNQTVDILYRTAGGSLNDKQAVGVYLPAGTFTLNVFRDTDTNRGLATFYLDGVSKGTIDFYASSAHGNDGYSTISLGTLTAGYHILAMEVLSKNGSSSNYQVVIYPMGIT